MNSELHDLLSREFLLFRKIFSGKFLRLSPSAKVKDRYRVTFLEVPSPVVILSRRRRISGKDETLRYAQGDNSRSKVSERIANPYEKTADSKALTAAELLIASASAAC